MSKTLLLLLLLIVGSISQLLLHLQVPKRAGRAWSFLVKSDITPSTRANCLELEADNQVYQLQLLKKPASFYDLLPELEDSSDEDFPLIPVYATDVIHYIGK